MSPRDLGPISASQSCHSMTLPLQGRRLSQALQKGQPDTISRRGKARGYWWVSDAESGLGRRTEESTGLQPHWGGWCEPRARGGSAGVFMTPAAWSTPAGARTADKQQVFRVKGTESTGVTQM